MLRETTRRDLCGLVCPSRTSERTGGRGDCVKGGGGEEGQQKETRTHIVVNHAFHAAVADVSTAVERLLN